MLVQSGKTSYLVLLPLTGAGIAPGRSLRLPLLGAVSTHLTATLRTGDTYTVDRARGGRCSKQRVAPFSANADKLTYGEHDKRKSAPNRMQ